MMTESTHPGYRCSTCKSTSTNPRNLAVFIDGTSNKPGHKRTNVMKLYEFMFDGSHPEVEQRRSYFEGIGVYEDINIPLSSYLPKVLYSVCEMGFAWNVEKNVKEVYEWLAGTYRQGDQIYLFGFSRGAYQVRALAGMIHEVGLVRDSSERRIDQAYCQYLSIFPPNPKTRESATEFKKNFCWQDVRIHFIGVWDTVSSLGLVKRDPHITSSVSVTHSCHFRHALALDELRVKFLPEYFLEINIPSSTPAVGDVREVWFPGYHSDVGGTSRLHNKGIPTPVGDNHFPIHAGNVPLSWMRWAAAEKGLVFQSEGFPWWPEDVDFGQKNSMGALSKVLEVLPIRHQVSFSGTGRHERRKHGFRPRSIIPGQHIHFSAFPGDMYTPTATLANGVVIPMVSDELSPIDPWTTEFAEEEVTRNLLASLLGDQRDTLKSIGEVLHLLNFRLNNGQKISAPGWTETSIRQLSGLDKFTLTVIYDVTSNFSAPEELVQSARDFLRIILLSPNGSDFPRALYVLRFSARHQALRQRFVAHKNVVNALMLALERISKSRSKNLFPLVMESLSYLIDGDHQHADVIGQLTAASGGSKTGKTRLSLAFEAKTCNHLAASLKMIASLARRQPDSCKELEPKVIELAKKETGAVGTAAVEVLVALNIEPPRNIRVFNIIGYLDNTLPRLDAEVDSTSALKETDSIPAVLQANEKLDEEVMRKLLSTIESPNAPQRTAVTLTLLKLCYNLVIRNFCSENQVLDIFMKQLKRKKTSLLAAYALNACLKLDMWKPADFDRAARPILTMLDKGWFDDAVGRVEGSKIFHDLMTSSDLRKQVSNLGVVATLERKLEKGDRHETRMGLIYLGVFWKESPDQLKRTVEGSIKLLTDPSMTKQKSAVKTLSSLARTEVGEKAIGPHVTEIVKMLLPTDGSRIPRSQLFGPTAAVYDLCKNETLRKQIQQSEEYTRFKILRRDSILYPQT